MPKYEVRREVNMGGFFSSWQELPNHRSEHDSYDEACEKIRSRQQDLWTHPPKPHHQEEMDAVDRLKAEEPGSKLLQDGRTNRYRIVEKKVGWF